MKKLLFLALMLCSCLQLAAQSEVVGRTVDTTGTTLPGSTVILLQLPDSAMAGNAVADAQV